MIYDINGNILNGCYDSEGTEIEQAYDVDGNALIPVSNNITVMTYNVQWFTGLNADESMQREILSTYNPDIIGLQELGAGMPSLGTTLFSDYAETELGIQHNKTGCVSKYTFSSVDADVFPDQTGETRGYQKAYFTFNGKTICWINTHLATSSYESEKVAQAGVLFDLVQNEEYFIITGDFNTVCKSVNDAEYTTIMKQFIDAGYNSANCSNQHGFIDTWTGGKTASDTWYPCDQIITSSNITIDNVVADTLKIETSGGQQVIDHIPLIAYLTVS